MAQPSGFTFGDLFHPPLIDEIRVLEELLLSLDCEAGATALGGTTWTERKWPSPLILGATADEADQDVASVHATLFQLTSDLKLDVAVHDLSNFQAEYLLTVLSAISHGWCRWDSLRSELQYSSCWRDLLRPFEPDGVGVASLCRLKADLWQWQPNFSLTKTQLLQAYGWASFLPIHSTKQETFARFLRSIIYIYHGAEREEVLLRQQHQGSVEDPHPSARRATVLVGATTSVVPGELPAVQELSLDELRVGCVLEHSPHMPRAFLLKLLSSSLAAVFVPAIPAARTLDRVTADICDAEPRELQQLNSHIAEMLAEINLPQCGGAVKLQHFAQGSADPAPRLYSFLGVYCGIASAMAVDALPLLALFVPSLSRSQFTLVPLERATGERSTAREWLLGLAVENLLDPSIVVAEDAVSVVGNLRLTRQGSALSDVVDLSDDAPPPSSPAARIAAMRASSPAADPLQAVRAVPVHPEPSAAPSQQAFAQAAAANAAMADAQQWMGTSAYSGLGQAAAAQARRPSAPQRQEAPSTVPMPSVPLADQRSQLLSQSALLQQIADQKAQLEVLQQHMDRRPSASVPPPVYQSQSPVGSPQQQPHPGLLHTRAQPQVMDEALATTAAAAARSAYGRHQAPSATVGADARFNHHAGPPANCSRPAVAPSFGQGLRPSGGLSGATVWPPSMAQSTPPPSLQPSPAPAVQTFKIGDGAIHHSGDMVIVTGVFLDHSNRHGGYVYNVTFQGGEVLQQIPASDLQSAVRDPPPHLGDPPSAITLAQLRVGDRLFHVRLQRHGTVVELPSGAHMDPRRILVAVDSPAGSATTRWCFLAELTFPQADFDRGPPRPDVDTSIHPTAITRRCTRVVQRADAGGSHVRRTCNAILEPNSLFCGSCGGEWRHPGSCGTCQAILPSPLPGQNPPLFCGQCGTSVLKLAAPRGTPEAAQVGAIDEIGRVLRKVLTDKKLDGAAVSVGVGAAAVKFVKRDISLLDYMRRSCGAFEGADAGIKMVGFGSSHVPLTGVDLLRALQDSANPTGNVTLRPDLLPRVRMTNALAYQLASGRVYHSRLSQYKHFRWTQRIPGLADDKGFKDMVPESSDPIGIQSVFSDVDALSSAFERMADLESSVFGVHWGYEVLEARDTILEVHSMNEELHTLARLLEFFYLARAQHYDNMVRALPTQGDAKVYDYQDFEIKRNTTTRSLIPRLDCSMAPGRDFMKRYYFAKLDTLAYTTPIRQSGLERRIAALEAQAGQVGSRGASRRMAGPELPTSVASGPEFCDELEEGDAFDEVSDHLAQWQLASFAVDNDGSDVSEAHSSAARSGSAPVDASGSDLPDHLRELAGQLEFDRPVMGPPFPSSARNSGPPNAGGPRSSYPPGKPSAYSARGNQPSSHAPTSGSRERFHVKLSQDIVPYVAQHLPSRFTQSGSKTVKPVCLAYNCGACKDEALCGRAHALVPLQEFSWAHRAGMMCFGGHVHERAPKEPDALQRLADAYQNAFRKRVETDLTERRQGAVARGATTSYSAAAASAAAGTASRHLGSSAYGSGSGVGAISSAPAGRPLHGLPPPDDASECDLPLTLARLEDIAALTPDEAIAFGLGEDTEAHLVLRDPHGRLMGGGPVPEHTFPWDFDPLLACTESSCFADGTPLPPGWKRRYLEYYAPPMVGFPLQYSLPEEYDAARARTEELCLAAMARYDQFILDARAEALRMRRAGLRGGQSEGLVLDAVSGAFGSVPPLSRIKASLRAVRLPQVVLASTVATIWDAPAVVADAGDALDGISHQCVPLHYAIATSSPVGGLKLLAAARARALLALPGLPDHIASVLEVLLAEISARTGCSPLAYGITDPADSGRPILVTDVLKDSAVLCWPAGVAPPASLEHVRPAEILARSTHAQVVLRDPACLPDLEQLRRAGRLTEYMVPLEVMGAKTFAHNSPMLVSIPEVVLGGEELELPSAALASAALAADPRVAAVVVPSAAVAADLPPADLPPAELAPAALATDLLPAAPLTLLPPPAHPPEPPAPAVASRDPQPDTSASGIAARAAISHMAAHAARPADRRAARLTLLRLQEKDGESTDPVERFVASHFGDVEQEDDYHWNWLTVAGDRRPTKAESHDQVLIANVHDYLSRVNIRDSLRQDIGPEAALGDASAIPEWKPTRHGSSAAAIYKMLASRIKQGDEEAKMMMMAHCDSWRKKQGSLEHMARDLMDLTPGRASGEVSPAPLTDLMKDRVPPLLQEEVLSQVTEGTSWYMRKGAEKVRQRAGLLPSARGKQNQLFGEVWKLVAQGKAFIFSPALLPEMDEDKVRISPYGLVPKKHLGKYTGKVRPINHGSWPRNRSLNDHTRTDLERAVYLPRHSDFGRTNLRIRYCFPAARILGCKADADGAFLHLFIHPRHVGDLSSEIDGHTIVSLVEFFGHTAAPTKYCSRADVIHLVHNTTDWLDIEGTPHQLESDTFVDDGFLQAPHLVGHSSVGNFTDWSSATYEYAMEMVNGLGSVSKKNPEETCWAPAQVVCGLTHFVEAGFIGLPDGKRKQAFEVVTSPCYQHKPLDFDGKGTPLLQQPLTLGKVREHLGLLVHCIEANPEFMIFLSFLVRCLKGMSSTESVDRLVSPLAEGEDPEVVWKEFYDDAATLAMALSTEESARKLWVTPYEKLLPAEEAFSSRLIVGRTQVMGTDASVKVAGGANLTLGKKWRKRVPAHVIDDVEASFRGEDRGNFQWTIGAVELAAATANELRYTNGSADIYKGLIDNAGSKFQLDKFKAKPLVSRFLLKVLALKRSLTKPLVVYSLVDTITHLGFDLISRSLDENGNPIPAAEAELDAWEAERGLALEWEEMPDDIWELVFPDRAKLATIKSLDVLRDLVQHGIKAGHSSSFAARALDESRPTPMPLDQASQVGQLMVDHPDRFPLPADSSELPPDLFASRSLEGPPTLTVLFCGYGGDALGGIMAGHRIVMLCDNDAKALRHVTKMSDCPPANAYLEFDQLEALEASLPVSDGITAGCPCPPYTILGLQRTTEDPRDRFLQTVKFICLRKRNGRGYKYGALEMVPGMLLCAAGRKVHDLAVCRLRAAGFTVGSGSDHDVIEAWDHGVPLHKIRHWLRFADPDAGYEPLAVVPTRKPEDPKCVDDLAVPHDHVAPSLFPIMNPDVWLTSPPPIDNPRVPHTFARAASSIGQPGDPSRMALSSGSIYVVTTSGNCAIFIFPDGTQRMLALVELIRGHGFPEDYFDGLSRVEIVKALGNCIVPQMARAVLSSFGRVGQKSSPAGARGLGAPARPQTTPPQDKASQSPVFDGPPLAVDTGVGAIIPPELEYPPHVLEVSLMCNAWFKRRYSKLKHACKHLFRLKSYEAATAVFVHRRDELVARAKARCEPPKVENPGACDPVPAPKASPPSAQKSRGQVKFALKEAKSRQTRALLGCSRTEADALVELQRPLCGRRAFALPSRLAPEHLALLREAKASIVMADVSSKTRSKYQANYKFFVEFAAATGRSHLLDGSDRMADSDLLTDYAVYEHALQKNAYSTIKVKLYATRYFNIEFGLPDPLADCPALDRVMRGIKRLSKDTVRKLPVTPDMLIHLLNSVDISKLRTRAVVTAVITAFMFLLRVSEYAADSEDIKSPHIIRRRNVVFKLRGVPVYDPLAADQVEITIPSSKTDQRGQGYTRTHFSSSSPLCPVRLLAQWVSMTSDIPDTEPLFAFASDSQGRLDCVTRSRVSKVLASVATDLGFPPGSYSSHSCRSGGATALVHAGVHPAVVQCIGRWNSDIWHIYSRFTAGLMGGVAELMSGAQVSQQTVAGVTRLSTPATFKPVSSSSFVCSKAASSPSPLKTCGHRSAHPMVPSRLVPSF